MGEGGSRHGVAFSRVSPFDTLQKEMPRLYISNIFSKRVPYFGRIKRHAFFLTSCRFESSFTSYLIISAGARRSRCPSFSVKIKEIRGYKSKHP